jgi:hypothetical protein
MEPSYHTGEQRADGLNTPVQLAQHRGQVVSRNISTRKRAPHHSSSVRCVAKTIIMTKYTTTESPIIPVIRERMIYVEHVEDIPDDAAVYHYDELDEQLKHRFPALIENAPTEASVRPESVLSNGGYVKFTEYYRVTYQ